LRRIELAAAPRSPTIPGKRTRQRSLVGYETVISRREVATPKASHSTVHCQLLSSQDRRATTRDWRREVKSITASIYVCFAINTIRNLRVPDRENT
jgi:hypothetical protein